jgi:phospholipid:diacylglycerol acyltransferase
MKDTAQLNALAVYGLEKFLSKTERADIFRAMPGISSMLPMGGNAVWGNTTWAPDDTPGQNFSYGNFLKFARDSFKNDPGDLTMDESLPYLWNNTEDWYSHGVAHTKREVEENQNIPRKWINPLETRLPYAPDMKIFCFYGVGKPTERAYYYKEELDLLRNQTTAAIGLLDPFRYDHWNNC